jgi:hypothetical protein
MSANHPFPPLQILLGHARSAAALRFSTANTAIEGLEISCPHLAALLATRRDIEPNCHDAKSHLRVKIHILLCLSNI